MRSGGDAEDADAAADEGGQHPDDQRPPELGGVGVVERRQVGHGQREVTDPGALAEADEDECADAGGEQAGQQHHRGGGAADGDGLHQQERAEQRRAEERGDGSEAAGAADHEERLRGSVALDEPHGQRGQPTAEGDERRLRADDGAEAERDHAQRGTRRAARSGSERPPRP